MGRLGAGGMGVVYYGFDASKDIDNEVALKVIRPHILEQQSTRARLEREINSLHSITSPYVARIVDADISGSPAWIATQRVNGPSLSQMVSSTGPLDDKNWFALAYGLFAALSEMSKKGIIHRDIKPLNILIERQGDQVLPKLIDFGISVDQDSTAVTKAGTLVGTPAWLAPEQISGGSLTPAVDVFSVASTLYFAATGTNPWGVQDTTPITTVIGTRLASTEDLSRLDSVKRELLEPLFDEDPRNRMSAEEAWLFTKQLADREKIDFSILIAAPMLGGSIKAGPKKKSRTRRKKSRKKQLMIAVLVALVGLGGLVIKSSQPLEAILKIGISSQYFDSNCRGISGLSGIENSRVVIMSLTSDKEIQLGRLNQGIKVESSICEYSFQVTQIQNQMEIFNLNVIFPWDKFSENFRFEEDTSNKLIHKLTLSLE